MPPASKRDTLSAVLLSSLLHLGGAPFSFPPFILRRFASYFYWWSVQIESGQHCCLATGNISLAAILNLCCWQQCCHSTVDGRQIDSSSVSSGIKPYSSCVVRSSSTSSGHFSPFPPFCFCSAVIRSPFKLWVPFLIHTFFDRFFPPRWLFFSFILFYSVPSMWRGSRFYASRKWQATLKNWGGRRVHPWNPKICIPLKVTSTESVSILGRILFPS